MSPKQQLIDDYKAAYRNANGCDFQAEIVYENGWFLFKCDHFIAARYRQKRLHLMLDSLQARAAAKTANALD